MLKEREPRLIRKEKEGENSEFLREPMLELNI